jgi:hypothetical protein
MRQENAGSLVVNPVRVPAEFPTVTVLGFTRLMVSVFWFHFPLKVYVGVDDGADEPVLLVLPAGGPVVEVVVEVVGGDDVVVEGDEVDVGLLVWSEPTCAELFVDEPPEEFDPEGLLVVELVDEEVLVEVGDCNCAVGPGW